jgi:hypothetical protein
MDAPEGGHCQICCEEDRGIKGRGKGHRGKGVEVMKKMISTKAA